MEFEEDEPDRPQFVPTAEEYDPVTRKLVRVCLLTILWQLLIAFSPGLPKGD